MTIPRQSAYYLRLSRSAIRRMGINVLIFMVFMTSFAIARPASAETDYCTPYIQRAEKKYKIPRGLLMAIAMVESGKNGRPWPWALNVGGEGIYPATYEEATRYLRQNDGTARPDVAVGCMQVYVAYHGKKFSAPEWMLHPEYNVAYAAQLLRKLYATHGNWTEAVAFYHASTNKRAQYDYVCSVFARLNKIRGTKPSAEGLRYCKILPKASSSKSTTAKPKPNSEPNTANDTFANPFIKPKDFGKK